MKHLVADVRNDIDQSAAGRRREGLSRRAMLLLASGKRNAVVETEVGWQLRAKRRSILC